MYLRLCSQKRATEKGKNKKWSWGESNSRLAASSAADLLVCEAATLPLSYSPDTTTRERIFCFCTLTHMSTLRIGHQLNRQSSKVAGGKHERCPDMHAHDAGRRCRYSAHLLLHANRICSIAATTDHHRSRLISQCCFSCCEHSFSFEGDGCSIARLDRFGCHRSHAHDGR